MFKTRKSKSERKRISGRQLYMSTAFSKSTPGYIKTGRKSSIMKKFIWTGRDDSFLGKNSDESQGNTLAEREGFEATNAATGDIGEPGTLAEETSVTVCLFSRERRYLPVRHLIDALCDKVEKDFIDNEAIDNGLIVSGRKPDLSLNQYLFRCVRNLDKIHESDPGFESSGVKALLGSIVYLERIVLNDDNFVVHKLNIHIFLMVGMLLATKYLESQAISNSFWSKVTGLDLPLLNELESALVEKCNHDVGLTRKQLDTWLDVVLDTVLDAVLDDSS